jgi:hypothetical protein
MTPNHDIPLPPHPTDVSKFTARDDVLLQAWLDADSALNRLKEIHGRPNTAPQSESISIPPR